MVIDFRFSSENYDEEEIKNLFREKTADYQHSNIIISEDTVFIYPEDLTDIARTRKCLIEAIDYALRKSET